MTGARTRTGGTGTVSAASDRSWPRGAAGAAPGKAVFIVDDDEDLRQVMAELLRDVGFCVEAAANGRLALDRLGAMSPAPALILLDLRMPIMDGIAFRAEQRRRAELCSIPVVLVSADRDADEHAQILGVDGFLRKPVTAGELVRLVLRLCASR